MNNIEAFILPLLGAALTMKQADIDAACDSIAARIAAAVNDTETKLDDAGADAIAKALRRIADGVDAGVKGATE